MEKGKSQKRGSKPPQAVGQVANKEIALPELADQSFASLAAPSRIHGPGAMGSTIGGEALRYRFRNIWDGIMPFHSQGGLVSIRDAVWLCQKAYFNVPIFRNSINTLAELCNTEIYLDGGNQQSRDFFSAWFQRINLAKLKDMFFRELFRSGNVFLFRVDGNLSRTDALRLNQAYGAADDLEIPLRYILLNVADISATDSITYENPAYFKVLTPQQIKMLKSSKNPDDKEVYQNVRKAIESYFDGTAANKAAVVPIDLSKLHTIFYQKQDYEPFAVPMGFAVLDDINLKLELKKSDAILARTVEHMTLLVTTGSEAKPDGSGGVSQKSISALREMFSKEQIGRVLVADYTTELDWSIPDLSKVLGPEKYEVVNRDISDGLMDIFFGKEAFANVVAKLKVFVEKLNRVQETFINDFLQMEIKRVAGLMNFKSFPIAKFMKVSLDDRAQVLRIFAQLMQLGILTPKDGLEAMETGELPDFSNLIENQEEAKQLKDKGLFEPIVSAYPPERVADAAAKAAAKHGVGQPTQKSEPKKLAGRPPGTKAPQTTKKVGPIGSSASSEEKFSMAKLIETIQLADKIKKDITAEYKKDKGVKRLSENHKALIEHISQTLFENEAKDQWESQIKYYVVENVPPDVEKVVEIEELAEEYGLSRYSAALLYHSKL